MTELIDVTQHRWSHKGHVTTTLSLSVEISFAQIGISESRGPIHEYSTLKLFTENVAFEYCFSGS